MVDGVESTAGGGEVRAAAILQQPARGGSRDRDPATGILFDNYPRTFVTRLCLEPYCLRTATLGCMLLLFKFKTYIDLNDDKQAQPPTTSWM